MSTDTATSAPPAGPSQVSFLKMPFVVIACGCIIGAIAFGPRSSLGLFMQPMIKDFGWGREAFAFAFALQNLIWGAAQPVAGALADRYGTPVVLAGGAVLYALGFAAMTQAGTPVLLVLTIGVLMGFGLAGASFNLVVTALGKIMPFHLQAIALGAATAAGSFGQFLFAPASVALMGAFDWRVAAYVFAAAVLLIVVLSQVMQTPRSEPASARPAEGASVLPEPQSLISALREAFGHRSYVLLVLGFFTCGFQLAFVTAHLPSYLVDRGLPVATGGWVLATIGLFNIIGALIAGWLSNRMPNRFILSAIYMLRAISIAIFITVPLSPTSAIIYGMVTGLTWLSTVPPTTSLVNMMFGIRWLAMLYGFAFFSHQVGGFLGVWLGGIAFERTGSYDLVWYLAIMFGVLSALINLPIVERPVQRADFRPSAAVI